MEAERESGDDPEVAAPTPERPEEVGVLLTVGEADPAVGGDDLDLLQVVHRPSEATGQVAEPAAEREAGEARLGHESEHRRQPMLLGGLVDVLQQTPRPDVRNPGIGVDRHVAHAGHVERQAALGDRGSGDVVASPLDAEQQPVVVYEPNRRSDVASRGWLDHESRGFGYHRVPYEHGIVPSLVAGAQQRALGPRVQVLELFRLQADPSAVEAGDVDRACGHDTASSLFGLGSARMSPARGRGVYTLNASKDMLAFGACQEPRATHHPSN
jgi:hypothetical protein